MGENEAKRKQSLVDNNREYVQKLYKLDMERNAWLDHFIASRSGASDDYVPSTDPCELTDDQIYDYILNNQHKFDDYSNQFCTADADDDDHKSDDDISSKAKGK